MRSAAGAMSLPRRSGPARLAAAAAALLLVLPLAGCANLGYYWQAVAGHLDLLQRARPVPQWIAAADTPQDLRARLELAQRIREFAVRELALPDNASYRRYADLGRPAVVWNVVAAPAFGLELKTWCFPVVGCVGYRGYFREADARALADALRADGWEVKVYGVPAYSTLGRLNWLGGDPLLNTFIRYPDGELARLIFHELAHQVVYVPGDTAFNESFATAVERLGVDRWLATEAAEGARSDYERFDGRRRAFKALTLATRRSLAAIYEANWPADGEESRRVAMKNEVMARFRRDYAALRERWGGWSGYDGWVAGANNASFAVQAAYDGWVPAFEALFAREGGDWPRFYDAVRALAALPPPQRQQALAALQTADKETPGA